MFFILMMLVEHTTRTYLYECRKIETRDITHQQPMLMCNEQGTYIG